MPQMTGKELIPRLRQIRPSIPVILMSGFKDASINANDTEILGVGEFVGKPFSAFALIDAIHKVLQKKSDSRPTG
jgi:FixJ family two-component response regulator